MTIPQTSIRRYKDIIRRKYSRILTDAEAREEYRRLLLGVDAVLKSTLLNQSETRDRRE